MNTSELSERQFQATNSEDFNYLKTGAVGYKELWDYVQTNVSHDRPNPIMGEMVQVVQMNDKRFTHYYVATQKKGTCFVVVKDNESNKILGHRWIEIALIE